jgi:hypothetical protein
MDAQTIQVRNGNIPTTMLSAKLDITSIDKLCT